MTEAIEKSHHLIVPKAHLSDVADNQDPTTSATGQVQNFYSRLNKMLMLDGHASKAHRTFLLCSGQKPMALTF
jgi:hypothetical protein